MRIDFSEKPDGATHFYHDHHGHLGSWWKVSSERSGPPAFVHSPLDGAWVAVAHVPGDLLPIPDQKPWAGEGLPPVGTLCEWRGPSSDGPDGWVYQESQVAGYSPCGLFVFMQAPSCWPVVQRIDNCDFRPIRTPEQIAAEERAREVGEMHAVFASNFEGAWNDGLEALYDAGYRKQVQP